MSDTDHEETDSVNPIASDTVEPGFLHIAEEPEAQPSNVTAPSLPSTIKPATPLSPLALERTGTTEHLAARRSIPPLDTSTPEFKQRLSALRTELTRILTGLRWEHRSVDDTADQLTPLLNVGSVEQWKTILIPFLYEIDRGGVLIPTWLTIIERGDPADLPHHANPAETMQGRARRFAILMLGNYRMMGISGSEKSNRARRSPHDERSRAFSDITELLGYLSTDPSTSLYATQSLVKHATVPAMEALIGALHEAKGWAKVDVVEGCLALKQERFYELLLAAGLDHAPGLESYLAIPIYQNIPLENYLHPDHTVSSPLTQNTALIFNQVLLDLLSSSISITDTNKLPIVFERHLPTISTALFEGARSNPSWQQTIALHHLGIFLGRYWNEISRDTLKDARIIEQVYTCLPMMNEVERWMAGPGRDILLEALSHDDPTALAPTIKVLGELREPRATSALIAYLENTHAPLDRSHALLVGSICDTLGRLGDRRAETPMLQVLSRTVDIQQRSTQPKQRDNLTTGHPDIPGSIVYAAVVRACGLLGDQNALEEIILATHDLDPYVRTQAVDAIRRLDPNGEDLRSRQAARDALDDPRDTVVRSASQLVIQYRDNDAITTLRRILETRPELSYLALDTLRQLGQ